MILSNAILRDYLEYFELFGASLYRVLCSDANGVEALQAGIPLAPPLEVYDHRIVCMRLRGVAVNVGDVLIVNTNQNPICYQRCTIVGIQVNHKDVQSVREHVSIDVGLRVENRVAKNNDFYLIRTQS